MCIQTTAHVYHRDTLVQIGEYEGNFITDGIIDTIRELRLLWRPAPQPAVSLNAASQGRGHRKPCARKRKCGTRAGVRARWKANASRPPVPSILIAIEVSTHKLDYIQLQ